MFINTDFSEILATVGFNVHICLESVMAVFYKDL